MSTACPAAHTVTLSSADSLGNGTSGSGIINVSAAPPPLAVTGAVERASVVPATPATINPHGQGTGFHFLWGTTSRYGSAAPLPDASIGADAHRTAS